MNYLLKRFLKMGTPGRSKMCASAWTFPPASARYRLSSLEDLGRPVSTVEVITVERAELLSCMGWNFAAACHQTLHTYIRNDITTSGVWNGRIEQLCWMKY